ncbi:hypothetical protein Trydic_g1356 [Trypoxylus dichotomus]
MCEIDISGITLRHYWKEYILIAINNISVDLTRSKDNEEAVVRNEVSELAKQVGLDNVEPEDIIELLQSHSQTLFTEGLEELFSN